MKKLSLILSLVIIATTIFFNFAQAQEKKKWSPQAKGTVIGAGTGAAAGAIINKRNRTVGGVVGGVVGGAAGYAIGKRKDNKNKEAARVAAANRAAAERAAAERAAANRTEVANKSTTSTREVAYRKSGNAGASANGFTAARSTMFSENENAIPYLVNSSYLPNEHYGDRTKPYSTSEYRRKSW